MIYDIFINLKNNFVFFILFFIDFFLIIMYIFCFISINFWLRILSNEVFNSSFIKKIVFPFWYKSLNLLFPILSISFFIFSLNNSLLISGNNNLYSLIKSSFFLWIGNPFFLIWNAASIPPYLICSNTIWLSKKFSFFSKFGFIHFIYLLSEILNFLNNLFKSSLNFSDKVWPTNLSIVFPSLNSWFINLFSEYFNAFLISLFEFDVFFFTIFLTVYFTVPA